jgi:hypothetical protein
MAMERERDRSLNHSTIQTRSTSIDMFLHFFKYDFATFYVFWGVLIISCPISRGQNFRSFQDGDMEATAEELENAREDLEDRLFGAKNRDPPLGHWG